MHLVLETTSPGLTLGAFKADDTPLAHIIDPTPRAADGLHTHLEKMLDIGREPLTHLTLTVGPGSFTGVRIGLAVAQALKLLSPNLIVTALSTLQAHACQIAGHHLQFTSSGFTILLDAAGGTVYRQSFAGDAAPQTEADCLFADQALHQAILPIFAPATLMLPDARSLQSLHPLTLLKMAQNPTFHLPAEPLYLKPLTYKPSPTNHE